MNNKNVSPEKKDSVLKTLAIAGFIGIIVLIAWFSIQLVHLMPGAFSSLASLAEGLNQYKETVAEDSNDADRDVQTFAVASEDTLIDSGNTTKINWGEATVPGSYVFRYECSEGVSLTLVNVDGLRDIECGKNYNVGDNTSLSFIVTSTKERYALVKYSVDFLRTNDTRPRANGFSSVTVFNSDISNSPTVAEGEEVEETPEVLGTTTTPVVEPETPAVTTPTPTEPTYVQEFTYEIPTSDPNGRTDLATRFLNIGTIVGNTFFTGQVKTNEEGAIQFEVKNYGTKTSKKWTYQVSLPNGGTYNSSDQEPLKPNERAVIVIGYPTTSDTTHTFDVRIDESTDKNAINDRFTQPVTFIR